MADLISMLAACGATEGEATDPFFENTVLLLHGDGTSGAQNNTFLDSSTNNFTITRNGNTTQGSFSPFSKPDGAWGNYFDGSASTPMYFADNNAFTFDADFTVEAWVYLNNTSAFQIVTSKWDVGGQEWILAVDSGGVAEFHWAPYSDGAPAIESSAGAVVANQWTHLAAVRSGSTITLYVNGVSVGTRTNGTAGTNQSTLVTVGYLQYLGGSKLGGYVSNLRIVKGTAVYTSAFTPSTSPLTAVSGTSLLTCQSSRFKDNSTNNFAPTVNGVKVTPFSPFPITTAYDPAVNGGSGYFDGSGDYLTVPDNAALDLSGDFTIEFVAYATGANNRRFLQLGDYRAGNNGLVIYSNASNALVVYVNGATIITGSAFPLNQWVYVALVRSGGGSNNLKLYMNAVQDGQATNTVSFTGVAGNGVSLGAEYGGSYNATSECYISNVRIVNGTALTPAIPTAPLTAISGTSLLCNFTNAGIFDNTGFNNLETVADAQIDTSVKKYGTGSIEFDGTGDYLVAAANTSLALGSGNFTVEMWIYPTAFATYVSVWCCTNSTTVATGFHIGFNASGQMFIYSNSAFRINSSATSGTLTLNQWNHLVVTRISGVVSFFVNGTQAASTWSTTQDFSQGFNLIGAAPNGGSEYFNGYIDDLRITKGIARYTSAFTPPTAAFPDIGE